MPAQEGSHRREKALLWVCTGRDVHAQPVVSPTSVELNVMWTDYEAEVVDAEDNTIRVVAEAAVDRAVPIGSIMWRGGYEALAEELPGTGSASTTDYPSSGLLQVVQYDAERDIKGRAVARAVKLMKWGDALPTQQV